MKKTDDSVKAGLQLEGEGPKEQQQETAGTAGTADNAIPEIENEKDGDELAHERAGETPDVTNEQDMDELVHKVPPAKVGNNDDEKDVDDLVHGAQ